MAHGHAARTGEKALSGLCGTGSLYVLFSFVFLAVALAFGPAQSQSGFQFSSIVVEGNQRIDSETIRTYAGIEPGQTISPGRVNDVVRSISDTGLFETVDVRPRGGQLVITVKEYPTINVINFEGNQRLKDEDLSGVIESRPRRVYNPAIAEADAQRIVEGYRSQGRLAATVEPKIIRRSDNRVDLVFEVSEGRVSEVERISFVGNRAYSERRLRRALETTQAGILRAIIRTDTLIEDRIEFDRQVLTDFYQSRGFVDFRVLSVTTELVRNRDGFLLTFNLREGQQFRIGQVTTSTDLGEVNADEYLDAALLRTGLVYNPALVDNDVARLERLAVQQGLNFIRVEPRVTRNDRDLTLDIEYVVTRGPRILVERIDIEGNTTTLDRVIRQQFRVVEGDPFNPREIRQAAERIRALGFFAATDVDAREGTRPDTVIIDVDVEEQPTGSLGFGASFSTNDGLGFNISFSERNFLGRGQTLSASINTTADQNGFSLLFVEPAFLGRDVGFALDTRFLEEIEENSRFNIRNGEIEPRLSFPIGDRARLQLRTTFATDEIFNVARGDPATGNTGSSAVLRTEEDEGRLFSFSGGYTYSFDSRRVGLNPTAGVLFEFSQDFGIREDDVTFVRSLLEARARRAILNEEVTLRAEFEAGAVAYSGGNSRIGERFRLGSRIRGFTPSGIGPRDLNVTNQDALGGNLFYLARLEAEFPLGLPQEYGLRGGVFIDAGSVWSLDNVNGGPNGLDVVDDSHKLRASIGVSIFWDTAFGPLRFNFSEAIIKEDFDEDQNFELTVSTRF